MIYLIGDTHGDNIGVGDGKKWLEIDKLAKQNDLVIQLGDFGYIWNKILKDGVDIEKMKKNGLSREKYYQEKNIRELCRKPYDIAVVLGNHENYDEIFPLPKIRKWGGEVFILERKNYGNIYFFERGGVYKIENKLFLIIGGALSIDRYMRKEGESWWQLEQLTDLEKQKILDNIKKYNGKFDYILSHTCPSSIIFKLLDNNYNYKINDEVAIFLDKIYSLYLKNFKKWYFGHFHIDKNIDNKFICLYNNIEKLELE